MLALANVRVRRDTTCAARLSRLFRLAVTQPVQPVLPRARWSLRRSRSHCRSPRGDSLADSPLGGDDAVVWPAAAVSAGGLALNVGLLIFLERIERTRRIGE